MSTPSPNINRFFSKFFSWHTLRTICDEIVFVKDFTSPKMRRYTTLWNINFRKTAPTEAQQRQTKRAWTEEDVIMLLLYCIVLFICRYLCSWSWKVVSVRKRSQLTTKRQTFLCRPNVGVREPATAVDVQAKRWSTYPIAAGKVSGLYNAR